VTAGILIGAVGVAAILAIGGIAGARPEKARGPITWATARLSPGLDRLRLARGQLTEAIGTLGAFVLLLGGGVLVVTVLSTVFGLGLAHLEHPVDWWALHLSDRLRGGDWASVMNVLTRMGDIPETRITGGVFAVLLAFMARRRWWAPGALILSVIVVERYQQSMLATIVDRGHPPTTLGTYPSGGCARLLGIYGAILFLILELSQSGRRTRTAAWTFLCAAGYAEGYSRWYLNKHWLTDVIGGWFYGALLLAVVVFAGRVLTPRDDELISAPDVRIKAINTASSS